MLLYVPLNSRMFILFWKFEICKLIFLENAFKNFSISAYLHTSELVIIPVLTVNIFDVTGAHCCISKLRMLVRTVFAYICTQPYQKVWGFFLLAVDAIFIKWCSRHWFFQKVVDFLRLNKLTWFIEFDVWLRWLYKLL